MATGCMHKKTLTVYIPYMAMSCVYIANLPSWSSSSIDCDFSPNVVDTRMLVQIAMEMSYFKFVARHLGFNKSHIVKLQEKYDTYEEQCYQMLRQWQENAPKGSPATLEELHRALCLTDQECCLPNILEMNKNYENVEFLSSITDVPECILKDREIDDNVLRDVLLGVATQLTTSWCHVGSIIGLCDTEIDEIQFDHKNKRLQEK